MFFGIVGNEASDINLDESLDPFIIEFENFSKLSDSFFLLQENGLLLNEDGLIVKFFEAIVSIWVKFTRWFADTMQTLFNFLFNASEKASKKTKENSEKAGKAVDSASSSSSSGDSEKKEKKSETIKRLQTELGNKDKEIEKLNKQIQDAKNDSTKTSNDNKALNQKIKDLEKQLEREISERQKAEKAFNKIEQEQEVASRFGSSVTQQIKAYSRLLDDDILDTYKDSRIIKLKDFSDFNTLREANRKSSTISMSKVDELKNKIYKSLDSKDNIKFNSTIVRFKKDNKDDQPLTEDPDFGNYYIFYKSICGSSVNKSTGERDIEAEEKYSKYEKFIDEFTNKGSEETLKVESIERTEANIMNIMNALQEDINSFNKNDKELNSFLREYTVDKSEINNIENSNRNLENVLQKLNKDKSYDEAVSANDLKSWLTKQLSGYIKYFKVYAGANRKISEHILRLIGDNIQRQSALTNLLTSAANNRISASNTKSGGRNNK